MLAHPRCELQTIATSVNLRVKSIGWSGLDSAWIENELLVGPTIYSPGLHLAGRDVWDDIRTVGLRAYREPTRNRSE